MAFFNNEGDFSSSSTRKWNYDVFLSFRGEDTREGFTSHLYKALCHKGIYTFIDDKLPRGEEISEELIQVIKNSLILVIVFSENYAESKWCLDELVEIVKCCEKDKEVKIRPVFYNVDPSEIRNQKGNFGSALANHEKEFENNKDKVQRWRNALRKAANASGWHYKKGEIVRQQAPDILEKRSRLCFYKDSLEVLTRNKGSKTIRGIMLHSPQSVEVRLHTESFRRMENLKFLIVENVRICEALEYLPNKLILLKWPHYPFHWPFKDCPEQLVSIEMPCSRIKLPKEEWRLKNLIDVNFRGCKLIKKLPKLWAPNLKNLDLAYCKKLVKLSELCAPNLEFLKLRHCENLVEIDECFGSLENLKEWDLTDCKKLQFLPSQLKLKSLYIFDLSGCSRLEKIPNFHPEMECLNTLSLSGSGIREVPSSIKHLTELDTLTLHNCKNLQDLPDSIYKLQQLRELGTATAKLRPTCNSFDSSSGYGFVKMTRLDFNWSKNVIELDLLMKPDYFPTLESIELSGTNIVTIPESISKFPRLKSLFIMNCKLLRKIQGLPQSICLVRAENCMLLDSQSPSGLLNQVIEIIGILPSRVCGSHITMDRQFSNHFPSETEGVEYEDRDVDRTILVWGTKMPKWFNHQSVKSSIFFWVGRKFPKLAVCIVPGQEGFSGFVDIFINGYEKREYEYRVNQFGNNCNLHLFSPTQRSLQEHLNESNPTDQNHVEVTYRTLHNGYSIKRWGVHVECTCPLVHDDDDVDYRSEFTFYGSDDIEEYQSPLVHDDTFMSCMSWLVGPTTKLFKLFCFCCPEDFSRKGY